MQATAATANNERKSNCKNIGMDSVLFLQSVSDWWALNIKATLSENACDCQHAINCFAKAIDKQKKRNARSSGLIQLLK